MNIRNVLKTYSLLRQLSDDETALLTTLRNLNDSEREQLVESLTPTRGVGKRLRQTRKKAIPLCVECGYAEASISHKDEKLADYHLFVKPGRKSPRATSLQKQLQATTKATTNGHCVFEMQGGKGPEACDATASDPIHDPTFGYAGYHEFQGATGT